MKSIIIAAGSGRRIPEFSKIAPKSLIKINNKSILKRQIDLLRKSKIKQIAIIKGFKSHMINYKNIKYFYNRNYKKNDDIAQYGDKAWVQLGVIAQELETAGMDKCVKQEVLYTADDQEVAINKTAKEGDIKEYKSVKYSILYMKAIKALQEAMAKIETLETKVKALEDA